MSLTKTHSATEILQTASPQSKALQVSKSSSSSTSTSHCDAQFLETATASRSKAKTKSNNTEKTSALTVRKTSSDSAVAPPKTIKIASKKLEKTTSSTRSRAKNGLQRAPKAITVGAKTTNVAKTARAVKSASTDNAQRNPPKAKVLKTQPLTISERQKAVSKISVTDATVAKAKRSRVPKNFAQTYGENVKERKAEVVPAQERKTRKTAAERERLRALMAPDDDILQRLARAHLTTTKPQKTSTRRTKNWQSRCGKCGVVTTFSTNASLCSRCGAIAVRD